MNKLLLLALLFAFNPAQASEEDGDAGELITTLLAVGKFTGGCGIMYLQRDFIKTTAMEGSGEFFLRFWKYESARLGIEIEEYVTMCKEQTELYEAQYSAFSKIK